MSRSRLALSVAFALFVASFPAFADVVPFTDNTFNLSDYSTTPFYILGASVSFEGQCSSCGNPGSALKIVVTTSPGGVAHFQFVNNTFQYDPETYGAIGTINASVDKDVTSSGTVTSFFWPLIRQDGIDYLAVIPGPGLTSPGTTGYQTISESGLVATDFVEFDFATDSFGTANPNFDGDIMKFGLASLTGPGSGVQNSELDYDNLSIEVETATPEPSSLLLLASILAGLFVISRRMRGKPVTVNSVR